MDIRKDILDTIGNTPLVKLNKITKDIPATVVAKIETFNPGNSIKDRIAVKMIDDAEKEGILKPGGTIIEGTSGNTGMGLALVAIVKGYKCICTMPDKQSKEKMDMLRALGVEVIVTPTNVAADDPKSYYSVAKRLNDEIPNSFYPNQYFNLSNPEAHYESTGPEIWEQTDGKITHLLVGVGTGGTISGIGKYLKEKNPDIQIYGIDTYGSVLKKYHETGEIDNNEIYSYLTEGIGEDIIPDCVDFDVIDLFEKVTDKDGMLMTRELARKEGIFAGNSAGCAVQGLLQLKDKFKEGDLVVLIFHDHGSRYVGKIFNDDWMRERGFLDKPYMAKDLINYRDQKGVITLDQNEPVAAAIEIMQKKSISQIPISNNGDIVGSVTEGSVFKKLIEDTTIKDQPLSSIMKDPFPIVEMNTPLEELSKIIDRETSAVLYKDGNDKFQIITEYDIIHTISK
ncbi:MAG: cystathionine beta-synthase [Bacteroidetes bacterium]|nr:pyridoxal-phosphate dependent enzyme [Bacteroidia bacterium]MBN4052275.1 pyridoxal-phosphate dependent enzyme [Sphingobacteriaceae bacterium AH-315-L07]PCH67306.1 MAG: cystathionine beta-synthase [Bacteroidota bacterium]